MHEIMDFRQNLIPSNFNLPDILTLSFPSLCQPKATCGFTNFPPTTNNLSPSPYDILPFQPVLGRNCLNFK